ncbi:MAG TPA: copper chaperone PCu(A)C [Methylotenera sp.]|nr:copper chaperone PCu(A)C [Methylotenera sp.]HPH05549.1 copper chaperone PCu(A)C [Methylotenera sp.]HPN00037.1 copper chaperone PCu(A)C [Methylotenera sp.]
MRHLVKCILALFIAVFSATSFAGEAKPVNVQDAWVRATAPRQKVGAAYMTLSYDENITLVAADADVAESVEIHSMEMKNGVMKMRSIESLPIQAGKPTKLAPNGLHLMLFGLQKPLKAGDQVELTLCFKSKNGEETHQTMTLPIKEFVR